MLMAMRGLNILVCGNFQIARLARVQVRFVVIVNNVFRKTMRKGFESAVCVKLGDFPKLVFCMSTC